MSDSLSDQLQIWGFEHDYIIFSDGSVGFGLDCVPLDVSTFSDERQNDLSIQIAQFLNSIPANTDFQFVQDIESGNDKVLAEYLRTSSDAKNETAKALCESRAKNL